MIGDIIVQRYAQALFDLGKEQSLHEVELYYAALSQIEELLMTSNELTYFLHAPIFTIYEKQDILLKLLELIDATQPIKNFCLLLAEKERLPLLTQIINSFKVLLDNAKNIVHGQLVTAITLDEKKQSELLISLEKQTNRKLELLFQVNPDILGGIVLHIGDKVFDASLRTQLECIRNTIKKGETNHAY